MRGSAVLKMMLAYVLSAPILWTVAGLAYLHALKPRSEILDILNNGGRSSAAIGTVFAVGLVLVVSLVITVPFAALLAGGVWLARRRTHAAAPTVAACIAIGVTLAAVFSLNWYDVGFWASVPTFNWTAFSLLVAGLPLAAIVVWTDAHAASQ